MASKIEALVRNFLRTDGDALYLVPGEKIFMLKGTSRQVVGREPLSEDSFRAVAGELAPGKALEALVEQKFRTQLKCDAQTPAVDILFGKSGQGPALMIRKAPEPEPDEAAYYATPAPIVDPSEQPPAPPGPGEAPRPAAAPR
ncbi:MAG: hypothetical protein JNK60_14430, partial [Acidobacteria bacterium]|nr:hypothetical protein [Acidobacteriota bacterium]